MDGKEKQNMNFNELQMKYIPTNEIPYMLLEYFEINRQITFSIIKYDLYPIWLSSGNC